MMTIRDLYHMCGNFNLSTEVRVVECRTYEVVFRGKYKLLPDELLNSKIIVFDFDNDLTGVVITVLPA